MKKINKKYILKYSIFKGLMCTFHLYRDRYLLEIELNDYIKQLLKGLKSMDQIKLYKRTQSWDEIYKMEDSIIKNFLFMLIIITFTDTLLLQ